MKTATVHELHPGHFRLVLRECVVYWSGTIESVLSALRSMGYHVEVKP